MYNFNFKVMKKNHLLFFMFLGLTVNAQNFGSSPIEVKGTYDVNHLVYGVWLRHGSSSNVTMRFSQDTEGINGALKMVKNMLAINSRSFDSPDLYNSYEENAENKSNPKELNASVQSGYSRINEGWMANDGSVLQLLLGSCHYEVSVINAYK